MDNYDALKELYGKLVGENIPMSAYEQQKIAGRKLAEVYGIRRGFISKVLFSTKRAGPFTRQELADRLIEKNIADNIEQAAGYVHAIINHNGKQIGYTSIIKFAPADKLIYYIVEGDH